MLPDLGPQGPLYLAIAGVVLAVTIARRIPVLRTLVSVAGWVVLAGLLVTVLGQREAFDPYLGRIAAAGRRWSAARPVSASRRTAISGSV
jgi:aspartyl protease family protein